MSLSYEKVELGLKPMQSGPRACMLTLYAVHLWNVSIFLPSK